MFPACGACGSQEQGGGGTNRVSMWSSGDIMAVRPSTPAHPGWGSAVGAPPRRLLIVEDDDDFAESLVNVLRSRGYELRHVSDAEKLWPALEGFTPEVALVDVRLGRHSGLDLVAEMKERRPELLN